MNTCASCKSYRISPAGSYFCVMFPNTPVTDKVTGRVSYLDGDIPTHLKYKLCRVVRDEHDVNDECPFWEKA